MADLVILGEQHLDREPPTVVTQATAWWEATLALESVGGGVLARAGQEETGKVQA